MFEIIKKVSFQKIRQIVGTSTVQHCLARMYTNFHELLVFCDILFLMFEIFENKRKNETFFNVFQTVYYEQ